MNCAICEMAIAGDYYATGNSALSDTDGDYNRETPRNPSGADVTSSNIPSEGDVALAYLYSTGWKNESSSSFFLNDACSNFSPN